MGNHSKKKTLDRALSHLGLCSRSQAQELIRAGSVQVDGRVVKDPELWVDPEIARFEINGERARPKAPLYLALHKPKGVVTTRHDPQGRKTIYDVLGPMGSWVAPVGRLDADTSGLILLTNNSLWADGITHPSSRKPKVYRIKARGLLDDSALSKLLDGVTLSDGSARAMAVNRLSSGKAFTLLELALNEGRNRQVRRMIAALGSKVQDLRRIRISDVELGDLPSGHWRHLTKREIQSLSS